MAWNKQTNLKIASGVAADKLNACTASLVITAPKTETIYLGEVIYVIWILYPVS